MEVSDQIIKVLDNLSDKFGVAIDWSQENILPYIQDLCSRIIKYDICKHSIWIMIGILIIISGVLFIKHKQKQAINNEKDNWMFDYYGKDSYGINDELGLAFCVVFGIISIIFLVAIIINIFGIIQDIYLPEKEIISLIKAYIG